MDEESLYVFAPPSVVSIGVVGTEEHFPVRRIYCVGRNYAEHAIEMGHDPKRESPFFFQKNPNNLLLDGVDFPYPKISKEVHHEVELIVALKSGGLNLSITEAQQSIFGYGVGIDMTQRDLQSEQKKLGRPWEVGKAFEHSAPCSDLIAKERVGDISSGAIWLDINGKRVQQGNLNQMIWKVEEVICELSKYFALAPGDLIMTGTPSGVGPVDIGDQLHAYVEGVAELKFKVV